MNKNEILVKLQEIFQDVLDNEDIKLTPEMTADDIEEWDSLAHVQLVVAMEKKFQVKFSSKEIISWTNVGEILECILSK